MGPCADNKLTGCICGAMKEASRSEDISRLGNQGGEGITLLVGYSENRANDVVLSCLLMQQRLAWALQIAHAVRFQACSAINLSNLSG